jgi:transcriptional regulator with XRE-family HTH domain
MTFSVGEALRGFRLRQGLTLSDIARRSGNQFKVSSLGAYERGDRSITFERLQLLAAVYGVDVQSLLGMRTPTIDLVALESRGVGIVIDLSRFRVLPDACAGEVMGFGQAIKRMRKESSSSVLVVRRSDASFLASILGCDPTRVDEALRAESPCSAPQPAVDPTERFASVRL